MAQFIVRVYRSAPGVRVVVDGLTHFDAAGEAAVEDLAARAILARLRAFLPERAPPPYDPDVIVTIFFEIALRRTSEKVEPGEAAPVAGS